MIDPFDDDIDVVALALILAANEELAEDELERRREELEQFFDDCEDDAETLPEL